MLVEDFLDRFFKKKFIISEDLITVDRFKTYLRDGTVGSNRITDKKYNLRIIHKNDILTHIDNIPFTYTEYSKLLLLKVMDYHNRKRFRNLANEQLSVQGLYAKIGTYPCRCYVDIVDNHFSIYKNFLFSHYQRSYRLLSDAERTYFYEIDVPKACKRYIYGIMRSLSFTHYKITNDNIVYSIVKKFHILHNRDVVNLINDVSQSICWYAKTYFGAVYCNTDGYVIPFDKVEHFLNFLKELGFNARVKDCGVSTIKGVGIYQVGNLKTLHFDKIVSTRDYLNLSYGDDFYRWLISAFKSSLKRGRII
ncbi:MAG: hypothetical protein ACP5JX_04170 [Sulfurihydrogenibium sp.]